MARTRGTTDRRLPETGIARLGATGRCKSVNLHEGKCRPGTSPTWGGTFTRKEPNL